MSSYSITYPVTRPVTYAPSNAVIGGALAPPPGEQFVTVTDNNGSEQFVTVTDVNGVERRLTVATGLT